MTSTTNNCKSMAWICLGLMWVLRIVLVAILVCLTLTGCSHKTTISEANNYLQIQAQQTLINTYKTQLASTKERLTQIPPEFQEVTQSPPQSRVGDLALFLQNNDCLAVKEKEYCYKLTRIRLIMVTQELDREADLTWAAKLTIKQLVENINTVIDGITAPTPFSSPPSP